MTPEQTLDALAERYGIEPEFVDAHGERRPTSGPTKRALLGALGVPADEPGRAAAALDRLDAADWERTLPPVVVARPAEVQVDVVLPAATGAVGWRLTLETGDVRSGSFRFSNLPLAAAARRGERDVERRRLALSRDLEYGYHRLRLDAGDDEALVVVTPGRCWLPPDAARGDRFAGLALQLYLLRSRTNWGIGDFSDLRRVTEFVAAHGADVLGLNPLHEMFLDEPEHASPYSPASRLALNVLNIDVAAIPEFAECATAQARVRDADFVERLAACRSARLVDYTGVAELKLPLLRHIFDAFAAVGSDDRRAAFAAFRAGSTPALERTHVFSALRDHLARERGGPAPWPQWPAEYRDPEAPAVAAFARDHAADVTFAAWLQWIADEQLGAAAAAARPMRVGLYRDLAVGADPGGAETWSDARAVVGSARVGAPPDIFNPPGQNWDLPPFHPHALRTDGYRTFIDLVRANMRHAGALRIDHVMALQHLYLIPSGAEPAAGAYVRYPLDDLIGILALESERARCLVVGEDLGTVPAGFRERMADANILSYRVLFFERDTDDAADTAAPFIAPDAYPVRALAVLGNHDLPTLAGWWSGADIALRERLGLVDAAAAEAARADRRRARLQLVAALERAGVILDGGADADADAVFAAAHALLAKTTSMLAIAQIDDVLAETDQVNVPLTADDYPNWRRRLGAPCETFADDPRFATLFAAFARAGRLRQPVGRSRTDR